MATYSELRDLFGNSDMKNRTEVATVKAAEALLAGVTPSTGEVSWAAAVLSKPSTEARKAYMFILAANSDATVEQITGASDAALQVNVNDVVSSLVIAYTGV